MAEVLKKFGSIAGFGDWKLGIGTFGNFLIWFIVSLFICGIIGFVIYKVIQKKVYKHSVTIIGLLGNAPFEKYLDTAKSVPVGRAGEKIFYLKKNKRFLPFPTIQAGPNKWLFWEKEDGELINVGYENLDIKLKSLGFKFKDVDMGLSRLGIEKQLKFRFEPKNLWEKYGQQIVNAVFYVLVTLLMIILITQMVKLSKSNESVTIKQSELWEDMNKKCSASPNVPDQSNPSDTGTGTGLVPVQLTLPLMLSGGT